VQDCAENVDQIWRVLHNSAQYNTDWSYGLMAG